MAQKSPYTLQTALVVGESMAGASAVAEMARHHVATVLTAQSVPAALREARRNPSGVVIVLEDVPEPEALGLVRELRGAQPQWRVLVVSERPTIGQAVQFTKAGAWDYLPSPLDAGVLRELMQRLAPQQAEGDCPGFLCDDCPPGVPIVGRSAAIVRALRNLRKVAQSRCNVVLLTGETGTGKELAARAVHAWRCGEGRPFVDVNCAALTAGLLESELFGHVKGAFTGADRDKSGLFELAGDGTLFLDEISEMPPVLQAKLLRVLQERTFRRVGGTKDIPCQATIIASSNRDLPEEVKAGRFRKDLYYRLSVFPVALAPLRSAERRSDVPLLASHFLATSSVCPGAAVRGLSPAATEALLAHDWPGNVRELRNVIDRALILEPSEWITPESLLLEGDLPGGAAAEPQAQYVADATPPSPREPSRKDFSLETAEREFILRALKETGWQRTRAAALLGITRATLHAKLKRYDIQPPDAGGSADSDDGIPSEPVGAQA